MGLATNPTSLHKIDVECTKSLTPEKRLVDRTDFSLRMKIEDFFLLQPLRIIRSSQTTLNRIHISFFSTVNKVQVQKEKKNHGVERQLKEVDYQEKQIVVATPKPYTIILWEFHGPKDVIFEGRQRPLICVETSQNRHFMTKLLKKRPISKRC